MADDQEQAVWRSAWTRTRPGLKIPDAIGAGVSALVGYMGLHLIGGAPAGLVALVVLLSGATGAALVALGKFLWELGREPHRRLAARIEVLESAPSAGQPAESQTKDLRLLFAEGQMLDQRARADLNKQTPMVDDCADWDARCVEALSRWPSWQTNFRNQPQFSSSTSSNGMLFYIQQRCILLGLAIKTLDTLA
jgi:hypothetical protein